MGNKQTLQANQASCSPETDSYRGRSVGGKSVSSDAEDPRNGWAGFSDREVRQKFIRRVYLMLMFQLLITLGFIALSMFEPNVKRFILQHPYIHLICMVVFFITIMVLSCCGDVRRQSPFNIILLTIVTLTMSVMLGVISTHYDTEAIGMAVGICALVTLLVSVFSFSTRFDFTTCGGVLFMLLLVLMIMGLVAIFVPSKALVIAYGTLGAIVFTMYLAFDTQMLMGGKTYQISAEEYVLAVLQLYLDIVNMFMYILLIIGGADK